MSTYLFIFTILAGASRNVCGGCQIGTEWKAGWQQAGLFDSQAACHKAAANLGLQRTEYRCLLKVNGEAQ